MKTSALDMKDKPVKDGSGDKIGEVVDFYFDADTSEPEWLVVETGTLGKEYVLVPLADATADDEEIMTPYLKDQIMDAPRVEGDSMDAEMERSLYEHYHLRRELPGRTEQVAAYEQDRSAIRDNRLRSWKSSAA